MRVLGIDPGTLNLGYGVVDEEGREMRMVNCGVLRSPAKLPLEQRLSSLYHGLCRVVAECEPDEVAIEEPFVADNVRSALSLGRAQAIAILAAANRKLPVFRYPPALVKQNVTNSGGSSKAQVQEMVRIQLGLSTAPEPSDASDALAVAICHLHQRQFDCLLNKTR
ncbi:MAG: crossover junction endodeoxyribonuclease RuvC [Chloroflexi bacterium]|nr:crossover junction endodeoxyribonuclease RuvC [Chloroflexota bacterium]MBM3154568.1 crossover junction endodeoxyribonuclease RuvC [Chloroflexota bacterium]MBM3172454.1 crossover junction endodeoxyribonuclease RuvC [Chloroflexota bacterium]MBM3175121.1 crossover junction endodeoxyribonuclease RuvC [Chloroflexota bacterium]MBM4449776.1 crossover junction endodeoxyribonuclease RuvC [Chloroflexota bacterium]